MLRRTLGVSALVGILMVSAASAQEQDRPGPGGPGGPDGPGFRGPGGPGFRGPGGPGSGGPGFGGPGFGGPGFGPGGMQGSGLILLAMPAVQQELGLSEEQKTDLNNLQRKMQEQMRASFGDFRQMEEMSQEDRDKRFAEAGKKAEETIKQADRQAAKILNAKQSERFGQLRLQREGLTAFSRIEIAKRLDLTAEQQAKIKDLRESFRPQAGNLGRADRRTKGQVGGNAGQGIPVPAGPQGLGFGPGGGPGPGGDLSNGAAALGSVKSQIRASDEEWKIIEPKLRKVIAARQARKPA